MLALEGGYDLPAICDSAQECVRALLGEPAGSMSESEMLRPPCGPAVETLMRTIAIQAPHWPCIKRYSSVVNCSAVEAAEGKIRDRVENETVSAMASLSMRQRCYSMESTVDTPPQAGNASPTSSTSSRQQSHSKRHGTPDDGHLGEEDISDNAGSNEEPMDQDEPGK